MWDFHFINSNKSLYGALIISCRYGENTLVLEFNDYIVQLKKKNKKFEKQKQENEIKNYLNNKLETMNKLKLK